MVGLPTSVETVLKKLGFFFDSEVGIYVHEKTNIPITVFFDEEREELVYLDQVKLPYEATTWRTKDWRAAADPGIKGMIVRGSQAIGCAAGYAFLLAAMEARQKAKNAEEFMKAFKDAVSFIKSARPTAYPLIWASDLALNAAEEAVKQGKSLDDVVASVKEAADFFLAADLALCWFLRQEGKKVIEDGDVIMTHCNGGSLSSSYGGHALGMIEEAYVEGTDLVVVSKETRPRSQGYKLTVWELNRAGVPVIIVTDNMIVSSFRRFGVSKVILGVDRVSRDGAVANKIGSADIAYIAKEFGVPFYYGTSYSTIDLKTERGEDIPIEERSIEEVTYPYVLEAQDRKRRGITTEKALDEWPPSNLIVDKHPPPRRKVSIYNPAFDVTPPELITAIITDIGTFKPAKIRELTPQEIEERVRSRLREWGLEPPARVVPL